MSTKLFQMFLIYAGIGGLTLFGLLIGSAGLVEKLGLLLIFGVLADQIVSIVKNLWF